MSEASAAVWLVSPGGAALVGFYRVRLAPGGPWLPARVYAPCPIEMTPEYWNPLDRNWRRAGFAVEVDGERITDLAARDYFGVPISAAAFDLLTEQVAWDRRHDPTAPANEPTRRVDLEKMKPIF